MTIETLSSLKLSFFAFGFIIFYVLESIFPNRVWASKRYKRLIFHTLFAAFNTILMRIPVLFLLMPVLILNSEPQNTTVTTIAHLDYYQFILNILILDLSLYWWHRLNHTNQFLWRFHFVHHADTHMDVGTSLRFHIAELIMSTFYKALIIYLCGITVIEFICYEIILVLSIQFHHSNLNLNSKFDNMLSRFIVTPKYHTNHHTRARESRDANYASVLTIWDNLFMSYKDANDTDRKTMGVENRDIELKFLENIYHPFDKNVDRK